MEKEYKSFRIGDLITIILISILLFLLGIIAGQFLNQKTHPDENTFIQKSSVEAYEITDEGIRLYTKDGLINYDITCKVKEEN